MEGIGRIVIGAGLVLLIAGGIFVLLGKLGVGSLPGDFSFKRGNLRIYLPLGSSILISIILTILLNLLLRRR
ncbi:MAG: DUF2905 domain-containing protein [Actinobacteria bacterium]|nr:DUF2905 domain-containing protein [Actinomycetota bacterium]